MDSVSDRWPDEVQAFFESLRDSTTFWVVGAVAVVIALGTFVGRRR